MRIQTVSLALAAVAAVAVPAAAAHAEARIGVVNVGRLLQEAPQREAVSQAIEAEFAGRLRDLENLQRDLRAREERLQKEGATMSDGDRRIAEKSLRDGQREMARKRNEYTEDLNIRRTEALSQLQRTVLQEVQNYAKSAGLDVVVADALYASPAVDITNQVLSALQSRKVAAPGKR
jgi:outer membrane protein